MTTSSLARPNPPKLFYKNSFITFGVIMTVGQLSFGLLQFFVLQFVLQEYWIYPRHQNIQNCLAHFVSGASIYSHITLTLKSLHWLPVKQRLIFWYSYISTLPLASQNTLLCICLYIHLLLKQDIVIQKRSFSKLPSTALQLINLKFISTSGSHMMLQNFGMT